METEILDQNDEQDGIEETGALAMDDTTGTGTKRRNILLTLPFNTYPSSSVRHPRGSIYQIYKK